MDIIKHNLMLCLRVWRGSNRMFWYGLNDFWFSHIGPLNKITSTYIMWGPNFLKMFKTNKLTKGYR